MRGDIPAAALRLCAALPVRTHERKRQVAVQGSKRVPHLVLWGVEYPSIFAAARKLGKSRGTIRRLIDIGEARFV